MRYEPPDRPSLALSSGLGFQYAALTIAGIALTPAIVARAAGASEAYILWAVFAALCVSGASTILQARRIGRFGAGHLLLMGTSGAFIAASVEALVRGGPSLLATLVIVSSLLQFLLAARLSMLRAMITPQVAGTMIMLIAVTIMPIVFDMMETLPDGADPVVGAISGAITLVTSVTVALVGKGIWRLWAPLAGVVVGCFVAQFHGIYDFQRVADAAWIGLPSGSWPGFDLTFGTDFWILLPAFVFVTIVGAIETIGDSIAIQQVSWKKPRATDFRAVQGAVNADGVGNLLSGLLGTVPNTTYSSTVSLTELTGVASTQVGVWIGIIFLVAAFVPKLVALVMSVPDAVAGAYFILLLSMLFVLGMRIAIQDGTDFRSSIIIGVAYWLGSGSQAGRLFADLLPEAMQGLFGNGMTSGGLAAVVLTLLTRVGSRGKKFRGSLDAKSIPEIDAFLRAYAKDLGWDPTSTNRLCAAAEEALLLLQESKAESGQDDRRGIYVRAVGDRREIEMEFVGSLEGSNIEDRLAVLGPWAEPTMERDVSLRLLRHYAKSVKHRQYHNTDIVTVKVPAASKKAA